jgi:ABC transport system ATP-binding/permease protein
LAYLRQHLDDAVVEEYLKLYDDYFEFYSRELQQASGEADDSSLLRFQVTNICGQINRELHQNDRMIVFLRLLEFVSEDDIFSDLERIFIQTVADSFNISPNEVKDAKAFILGGRHRQIDPDNLLIIRKPKETSVDELEGAWVEMHKLRMQDQERVVERESLNGKIIVLFLRGTGTFVFRYNGNNKLTFEGRPLVRNKFYIFKQGGIIRGNEIAPIYYSEVSSWFFRNPGG